MSKPDNERFYTNFFKWGNNVFVRGYNSDGSNFFDKIALTDNRLYVLSDTPNCSNVSFFGNKPLEMKQFRTVKEANKFIDDNKDYIEIYGYDKFDYLAINDHFGHSFNVTQIRKMFFDIETYVSDDTDHGNKCNSSFPNIFQSEHEINLITTLVENNLQVIALEDIDQEWNNQKIKEMFGKKYPDLKIHYVICKTEKELLNEFIKRVQRQQPDILTGWNTNGFDLPYIHSRLTKYFSDEQINQISPFGITSTREYYNDKSVLSKEFSIKGISQLDYLDLYKKIELSPRPNYKLDTILGIELNASKLEYTGPFRSFYKKCFAREFTLYNIVDVIRVKELDDTLKFMDIAFMVAYKSKCNYVDILSPTRIWDNLIALELAKESIELPSRPTHRAATYEGAFVKPVQPGKYEFLVTFDVGSLYPSTIMQNNISPETMLSETVSLRPSDVTNRTEKFRHAQKIAQSLDATLCSNGNMFSKKKVGIIPKLLRDFSIGRSTAKNEMKERKRRVEYAKTLIKKRKEND